MPNRTYTYVTLPDECIQIEWKIYDKKIPEDGVIKSWKKNADLDVKIGMYINLQYLNAIISEGAKAAFYISYHSLKKFDGTGLQRGDKLLDYEKINETGMDFDFNYTIPGDIIAGSLELTFTIALEEGAKQNNRQFATQPGSILYEKSILVHLEGNQALFPVKAIDFSSSDIDRPNALYYLSRKFKQLDSNFTSSYTLYFNSIHPLFKKINIESQSESSNQYLLKTIMYDVYRTIVLDALDDIHGLNELDETENEENSFSLQSVYSRIIRDLIRIYFPDKDLAGLRNMINSDEDSRNKLLTAVQDYILGE